MEPMLKFLRLKVSQTEAVASERNALRADRDAIKVERDDLLIASAQLADALAQANVLPLPPRHLQERVVGWYSPDFVKSATRSLREFNEILCFFGKSLLDFDRVLDLGVGCGRIIRCFHELRPRASFTGADIDAEAIEWLEKNYGPFFGRFVVLPHLPPSELGGCSFDLVYAVSVFTHLDETMQFAWLGELRRVTAPGGYLLITVHGRHHRLKHPREMQEKILAHGFHYCHDVPVTVGLPTFYKHTFHTKEYVEREWSRFFDILHYQETGSEGHQDLILCRNRSDT
jgi:SAM-dependent methyltransferase